MASPKDLPEISNKNNAERQPPQVRFPALFRRHNPLVLIIAGNATQNDVEAEGGIEPPYTALQAAA